MANFNFFAFSYKIPKNSTCVKKLSEGATTCLFHSHLQASVAAIMKLKARAGIIFRNCEKSRLMMGTPGKGAKVPCRHMAHAKQITLLILQ